jgi:hypothetical protein
MTSPYSRLISRVADLQFRKDPSGRSVFLPLGPRGKAYVVDTTADEQKIKAFVKMYKSASMLISLLTFPAVYFPGVFLADFAGLSPKSHRLAISLGVSMFFALVLAALQLILWAVYKGTVPGVTSSLLEVGPDLRNQLTEISPQQRRVQRIALIILGACTILLGLFILAVWEHFRR